MAKQLATRLGWKCLLLGEELRKRALTDQTLSSSLEMGFLAPESMVQDLVAEWLSDGDDRQIVVDGYPRHPEQVDVLDSAQADWHVILLDLPEDVAVARIQSRRSCSACGHLGSSSRNDTCPVCGSTEWRLRQDDLPTASARRFSQAITNLCELTDRVPSIRLTRVRSDQPMRLVFKDVLEAIETFCVH